jgi:pimeloyl-ACP methyl ester carboxylesterase
MPRAQTNGIELEYATHGDAASGRPLLMLRGLGTQMIQWAPEFVDALVAGGHYLVTFDNRDVGRSTWLDDAGQPSLSEITAALQQDRDPAPPYTLGAMADDMAGLMDALGLETAHVAGISMGGMLTPVFGHQHPERVRSLVSIMASTGNPALPPPTKAAMEALMTPAPSERAAYIEHFVWTQKAISSPGYPIPDEARAEMAGRVFDRAFHPAGTARQYAAIVAAGDRREAIASITAPTLVIHGLDDPLVPVEGGRDIAATIPGAELLEIPGMGHDVPPGLYATIATAISDHTRKSESR